MARYPNIIQAITCKINKIVHMADTNQGLSLATKVGTATVTTKADTVVELDNLNADLDTGHVTDSGSELRTAVAEIGAIQEQEKHSDVLHEKTKCSDSKICFYRVGCGECCVPVVKLKASMLKTQVIGKQLLKRKLFPLFSTNGRELWTYLQFLMILGFAIKSAVIDIAVSNPNERTAVDYVSLVFSLIFLPLSVLDIFITIYIHKCSLLCTPCRRQCVKTGNLPSTNHGRCAGSFCLLFKSKYAESVSYDTK